MKAEDLISITEICKWHKVEVSFVMELHEKGLINAQVVDRESFIEVDQTHLLEKMIRLHYDLDINTAGIEAIIHLLEKIHALQDELGRAKNRLDAFGDF